MNKTPLIFLAGLIVLTGITGCSEESAEKQAKTEPVVVYSARAEHLIKPLFDQFTQKTGIPVHFQTGKASALVERVKAEGENSPADILMTVDVGNLWYAADQNLFAPINSEIIKNNIPAHLRDPNLLWTGLSVRARTIVYNTQRVDLAELSSYQDLADPKWQGRLCLRTSDSVYNKSLVSSMIVHFGEEETSKTLQGWVANLATKPQSKDSLVMDAILAGQCDVGIINSYYYGRLESEKPDVPLKLFWANQNTTGTHINVSGAGILKHAKHPENALKLIEWLSAKEAQMTYGAMNKEYPANLNVVLDDQIQAWGAFKQDELNLSEVGHLQEKATRLINRVGYQ